jgi:hypothetical protein
MSVDKWGNITKQAPDGVNTMTLLPNGNWSSTELYVPKPEDPDITSFKRKAGLSSVVPNQLPPHNPMSNRPTGMGNINKTPYNPTGAPTKEGEEPKIVATLLTNPPKYEWSDGSVTSNRYKPGSFEEDEAINEAKNLEERKKAFQQRKGGGPQPDNQMSISNRPTGMANQAFAERPAMGPPNGDRAMRARSYGPNKYGREISEAQNKWQVGSGGRIMKKAPDGVNTLIYDPGTGGITSTLMDVHKPVDPEIADLMRKHGIKGKGNPEVPYGAIAASLEMDEAKKKGGSPWGGSWKNLELPLPQDSKGFMLASDMKEAQSKGITPPPFNRRPGQVIEDPSRKSAGGRIYRDDRNAAKPDIPYIEKKYGEKPYDIDEIDRMDIPITKKMELMVMAKHFKYIPTPQEENDYSKKLEEMHYRDPESIEDMKPPWMLPDDVRKIPHFGRTKIGKNTYAV